MMDGLHLYKGGVIYVMEGNRYDVVIDTGFFLTIRVPIELQGLELPPLRTQSQGQRAEARAAKDAAMELLLNRWVVVETVKNSHRPSTWSASIYIEAQCDHDEAMTEVLGKPMVDFSAYMNLIREVGYDTKALPLNHAETTKRRRKSFQSGR